MLLDDYEATWIAINDQPVPYYFEKMVDGEGKEQQLFDALPKLDRSPQIGFREIERVKEYVQS